MLNKRFAVPAICTFMKKLIIWSYFGRNFHSQSFFIDNCIQKVLNKLFIKRIRDYNTSQKKEITISLEYLRKISLLAKNQLTNIFRSCRKDIKLTSFSKHPIDSATHLDLKTNYPNVSTQKCYINISATFSITPTLAKPNAI